MTPPPGTAFLTQHLFTTPRHTRARGAPDACTARLLRSQLVQPLAPSPFSTGDAKEYAAHLLLTHVMLPLAGVAPSVAVEEHEIVCVCGT